MSHRSKYQQLPTEAINPATLGIDKASPADIIELMLIDDRKVLAAVQREKPRIALGVDIIVEAVRRGGRVIFVGAGTSDVNEADFDRRGQVRAAMRTQFRRLINFILAFATRIHSDGGVRELSLDVFGGPARGSSQFIVTKRAAMSQFEAVAIVANIEGKMERAGSVFSQTLSSNWIFLAAKKWRKPRRLPPMILNDLRQKSYASAERRAGGIRRAA